MLTLENILTVFIVFSSVISSFYLYRQSVFEMMNLEIKPTNAKVVENEQTTYTGIARK